MCAVIVTVITLIPRTVPVYIIAFHRDEVWRHSWQFR
jgi:hypothetical protein